MSPGCKHQCRDSKRKYTTKSRITLDPTTNVSVYPKDPSQCHTGHPHILRVQLLLSALPLGHETSLDGCQQTTEQRKCEHVYHGALVKKNPVVSRKMDGTRSHQLREIRQTQKGKYSFPF